MYCESTAAEIDGDECVVSEMRDKWNKVLCAIPTTYFMKTSFCIKTKGKSLCVRFKQNILFMIFVDSLILWLLSSFRCRDFMLFLFIFIEVSVVHMNSYRAITSRLYDIFSYTIEVSLGHKSDRKDSANARTQRT